MNENARVFRFVIFDEWKMNGRGIFCISWFAHAISLLLIVRSKTERSKIIPNISLVEFDFLNFKKEEGSDKLHGILREYSNVFLSKSGFYSFQTLVGNVKEELMQTGLIRVNCIDCLDRTNYGMTFIAACALYRQLLKLLFTDLELYLKNQPTEALISLSEEDNQFMSDNFDRVNNWVRGEILVNLSKIYSKNGDAISKQYWGSKAMHGTSMSMDCDGEVKVDKRNENAFIFTKRYVNNVFGRDMKKQSALWLVTGHFKFKDVRVHPWTINFSQTDVNFDYEMHTNNINMESNLLDEHAQKVREMELDMMFSNLASFE